MGRLANDPLTGATGVFGGAAALGPRPGGGDGGLDLGCEPPLEVLAEHRRELGRLRVVRLRVRPGRARVEQGVIDTRDLDRHLEAEHGVDPVLGPVRAPQSAAVRSARVASIGIR